VLSSSAPIGATKPKNNSGNLILSIGIDTDALTF
jgi:hypothetical protein